MIYTLFMSLAMIGAWLVARTMPRPPRITAAQRFFIGTAGFCCAVFAAKLPFLILGTDLLHNAGSILLSGKTILFGLVGGYVGVEFAKWYLGIKTKTGDYFAAPVAAGVGIGRLGCFFSGCCYGTPTGLPWGVVFPSVDQLRRHPSQLYEFGFHIAMAGILWWAFKEGRWKGQLIKLYFLAYFLFRFMTEFARPEIRWTFGMSGYQWAILVLAPVFVFLWWLDEKNRKTHPKPV